MSWMRQNPDPEIKRTATKTAPAETRATASPPVPRVAPTSGTATIGASVELNGDLVSSEDLTIEGKVQGKITMKGHKLTIGDSGRVRANVRAKSIVIAGQLKGRVSAADKVEIAATGALYGDVVAPRVAIAEGAKFKGAIDMEGAAKKDAQPARSNPEMSVKRSA